MKRTSLSVLQEREKKIREKHQKILIVVNEKEENPCRRVVLLFCLSNRMLLQRGFG